jgi:hypothetical protein
MHKTLYTPTMIDTFRACKHAYLLAFLQNNIETESLSFICKQFLLRALSQINKGKITTISQLQKYMGQYWPADELGSASDKEAVTKAFLYVYKSLLRYLAKPYRPAGSKVVGVALNVRARVPNVKVYIEDTFDLILWFQNEQRLEFVDFTLQPLKNFDPAWPSTEVLVKKYLAEKLKTRWPYKKLSIRYERVGLQDYSPLIAKPEESIYRLHWAEIVKNLEDMQTLERQELETHTTKHSLWQPHDKCRHCETILARLKKQQYLLEDSHYSMTA